MRRISKRSVPLLAGSRSKDNQMELRFQPGCQMVVQVFLSQENVQNERAAGIADTVQRGLGTLPQQEDLRRLHRRGNRENA